MMVMHYSDPAATSMNTGTTYVPVDFASRTSIPENAYKSVYVGISSVRLAHIDQEFCISRPGIPGEIRVLQPFYIKVQPVEGGFVATSDISDVYELGESPKQAILNYLYSLIDDLIWFLSHKNDLSSSMLKDLTKLQFFFDLV